MHRHSGASIAASAASRRRECDGEGVRQLSAARHGGRRVAEARGGCPSRGSIRHRHGTRAEEDNLGRLFRFQNLRTSDANEERCILKAQGAARASRPTAASASVNVWRVVKGELTTQRSGSITKARPPGRRCARRPRSMAPRASAPGTQFSTWAQRGERVSARAWRSEREGARDAPWRTQQRRSAPPAGARRSRAARCVGVCCAGR